MGRHIASELAKCGTSIGANAEEAQDGQTKPDFIAKLAVSRKESRVGARRSYSAADDDRECNQDGAIIARG